MGLDSSAYGNYTTLFVGILQIHALKPQERRYLITKTAVVHVFPSRNGWFRHNKVTKSTTCFNAS